MTTRTGRADVGSVAEQAIIASDNIVGVHAARHNVAAVVGTKVAVVAVRGNAANTSTCRAGVRGGTSVAVVASGRVVGVHAASKSFAAVVGAAVAVITVGRLYAETSAQETEILGGTGTAIIAGRRVVHIVAADRRVAAIVGTQVTVVAIGGRIRNAGRSHAGVVGRASITIITTAYLERTGRRATIAVDSAAVIALLGQFYDAVATNRLHVHVRARGSGRHSNAVNVSHGRGRNRNIDRRTGGRVGGHRKMERRDMHRTRR